MVDETATEPKVVFLATAKAPPIDWGYWLYIAGMAVALVAITLYAIDAWRKVRG